MATEFLLGVLAAGGPNASISPSLLKRRVTNIELHSSGDYYTFTLTDDDGSTDTFAVPSNAVISKATEPQTSRVLWLDTSTSPSVLKYNDNGTWTAFTSGGGGMADGYVTGFTDTATARSVTLEIAQASPAANQNVVIDPVSETEAGVMPSTDYNDLFEWNTISDTAKFGIDLSITAAPQTSSTLTIASYFAEIANTPSAYSNHYLGLRLSINEADNTHNFRVTVNGVAEESLTSATEVDRDSSFIYYTQQVETIGNGVAIRLEERTLKGASASATLPTADREKLDAITDTGSGEIITDAERTRVNDALTTVATADPVRGDGTATDRVTLNQAGIDLIDAVDTPSWNNSTTIDVAQASSATPYTASNIATQTYASTYTHPGGSNLQDQWVAARVLLAEEDKVGASGSDIVRFTTQSTDPQGVTRIANETVFNTEDEVARNATHIFYQKQIANFPASEALRVQEFTPLELDTTKINIPHVDPFPQAAALPTSPTVGQRVNLTADQTIDGNLVLTVGTATDNSFKGYWPASSGVDGIGSLTDIDGNEVDAADLGLGPIGAYTSTASTAALRNTFQVQRDGAESRTPQTFTLNGADHALTATPNHSHFYTAAGLTDASIDDGDVLRINVEYSNGDKVAPDRTLDAGGDYQYTINGWIHGSTSWTPNELDNRIDSRTADHVQSNTIDREEVITQAAYDALETPRNPRIIYHIVG